MLQMTFLLLNHHEMTKKVIINVFCYTCTIPRHCTILSRPIQTKISGPFGGVRLDIPGPLRTAFETSTSAKEVLVQQPL